MDREITYGEYSYLYPMRHYDNTHVRRQDRLLTEEEAMLLLAAGEYGFLAMATPDSAGYGIPISYAWEPGHIYFHCAPEGEKLRLLEANNRVSFCVVGRTNVISNQFTTGYESVLVRGIVTLHLTDEEKRHALELLLDKYSPDDKEIGLKYAEKSFHRTNVFRLDIKTVSGKTKRAF